MHDVHQHCRAECVDSLGADLIVGSVSIRVFIPLLGCAALAAVAIRSELPAVAIDAGACTMLPGQTQAVVRVEKDTILPYVPAPYEAMSSSGVRGGDSLLATGNTQMPAGRVRLLQLDSVTRRTLAAEGVTDSQPAAFVRAAPYRADCRTVRWLDTIPFVVRGEVGYVRGTVAPREQWVNGVPIIIIRQQWLYPYPRRRGLAFRSPADAPLASAEAVYGLSTTLNLRTTSAADSAARARAIAWTRANVTAAELEPVRTTIREVVLRPDWLRVVGIPSRLRGTWRVALESDGKRATWFFRTHEFPGYSWRGADSLQTTAALLAAPYISGYSLVGYAGTSPDSLPSAMPRGPRRIPMVWLKAMDQPTTPGNESRRALNGVLEFTLHAAPEAWWDVLEGMVPRPSGIDSVFAARISLPRAQQQPQIPIALRLDGNGGINADTTFTIAGRSVRLMLERIDTLSNKRPF